MSVREQIEDDIIGDEAPVYAGARLAYIKSIGEREARALGVIPSDIKVPSDFHLYAIHAADGTPLAIVENRDAAFGAALQNELVPLSVH